MDGDSVVDIPLLAFGYVVPVDGLPILTTWNSVLKDVLYRGFENWREVFEVKPMKGVTFSEKQPFDFGTVQAVKGLGRLSMILWAVLHTYLNLRDTLTKEEKEDFCRHLGV